MPSSLIDIADWIDRFGMELLDADAALEPGGAADDAASSTSPGSAPVAAAVAPRRNAARRNADEPALVVLDFESCWTERVPELLH